MSEGKEREKVEKGVRKRGGTGIERGKEREKGRNERW